MGRNPEVDAWFAAQGHPLEDALQKVREITLAVDERIEESIKWKTPTFAYAGNIFSFNPAKRFVSLLFHRGAHLPGTFPGLEGEGETARVMRFADLADVEARAHELEAVIRAWCDWRDAD
jgi:hypothetical protein